MDFDESEVMFSDYSSDQSVESNESESEDSNWKHDSQSNGSRMMIMNRRKGLKKKPRISSSAPVNIPEMSSFRYDMDVANYQPFDDRNDDDDQMMRLPPHLIIERRVNEEVARSFSPLKGKNLCQVRNSILRMTGFLER
ncbi:Protein RST1 [Bienertia sinuspersici]